MVLRPARSAPMLKLARLCVRGFMLRASEVAAAAAPLLASPVPVAVLFASPALFAPPPPLAMPPAFARPVAEAVVVEAMVEAC